MRYGIDYDYYDYIGEQDDRNRRRHNRMVFIRVLFALFVGSMVFLGIASFFLR